MKVCFFLQENKIYPGAIKSALNLMEQLQRHFIEVIVILPRQGTIESELKKMGIKWKYCKTYALTYKVKEKDNLGWLRYIVRKIRNYYATKSVKRELVEENIDVVHINKLTGDCGLVIAKSLNIPCVWHIREFLEDDYGRTFYREKEHYHLMEQADYIIAISNEIKKYFAPKIKKQIAVVYNGIESSSIEMNPNAFSDKSSVKILISATIIEGKNQLEALEALNILKSSLQNINFIIYIVGKTESKNYEQKLHDYVNDNKLNENVIFYGYTDDINSIRKNCDVGLCCSVNEAFGRVNVESMMAKILAIGSRAGGTQEIIEHGKTGLLYEKGCPWDLADKLLWAIAHQSEVKQIIDSGYKDAKQRFSIQSTANNMMKIYNEVIETGAK